MTKNLPTQKEMLTAIKIALEIYTKNIYRLSITYLDKNLEFCTIEEGGAMARTALEIVEKMMENAE